MEVIGWTCSCATV